MTENDGGARHDPQPDPGAQPTQPLPDSSGAEPVPPGPATSDTPAGADPGPATTPYGQAAGHEQAAAGGYERDTAAYEQGGYQQPGTQAPYDQPGAYGPPGAPAAPQYGYAPTPPKNDLGVWALVTGILSYVMCPLLLGIAAIVTGTMSRRAADEGLANNRGMGTAGLILGWINVALVLLGIAFFVVALAAGLLAGGIGEWGDMNDMERYSDY